MLHNCVIVQPLTEMSIDLEDDFMELVAMDDSDDDELEERMEGFIVCS